MKLSENILKAMTAIAVLASVGLTTASAQDDSTLASQPPAPPVGWTDGYVMANEIRIHYWRTGGNKPVLLMAHGSSDDGLCWTNLAKELTDDYDIILPDARGHGLSDPPRKSDSADAQAEDLAGLIRALKLEKPILMGHSMGSSSVAWFPPSIRTSPVPSSSKTLASFPGLPVALAHPPTLQAPLPKREGTPRSWHGTTRPMKRSLPNV